MNKEQILQELEAWEHHITAMEDRRADLVGLFGSADDSAILGQIDNIMTAYTKMVARHVGDYWDYLIDYWMDMAAGDFCSIDEVADKIVNGH